MSNEKESKDTVEAYCMKCKNKVPMNVEKREVKKTSRGLKGLLSGFCSVCNGKVCKIVKASEIEGGLE